MAKPPVVMRDISLIRIMCLGVGVAAGAYGLSLLPAGVVDVGQVQNINGIPYPQTAAGIHVTESLAHADVYLPGPVLGKALDLTVSFTPNTTEVLAVGVRESEFWLSYPKVELSDQAGTEEITRTVRIPLTDKLQERDQSIDVMLFARTPDNPDGLPDGTGDTTSWYLHDIEVQTVWDMPSMPELKDYIRSIVTRERPA